MADLDARLAVVLDARIDQFERKVQRAEKRLENAAKKMQGDAARVDQSLTRVGDRFGNGIVTRAGVAVAALAAVSKAVNDIVRNGEKITQLEGRFTALTGSAERGAAAIDTLFGITSRTGADIDGVAASLTRFTIAAEALGATDSQVARLTENVLKLGAIGGGSGQELAAGAQQLAQALASGVLQGDELKSILENMPLVAKAIADGLGVSVGQLRAMGAAGELTSRKVFDAILAKTDEIETAFNNLPASLERSAGRLAGAWAQFTAELDRSLGVSQALAGVLGSVADNLNYINAAGAKTLAGDLTVARVKLAAAEREAAQGPVALGGGVFDRSAQVRVEQLRAEVAALESRAANAATPKNPYGNAGGEGARAPTINSGLAPLFAPTPDRPTAELGVPDLSPGRGGGGGSSRATESAAAGVIDRIRERIQALSEERAQIGLTEAAQAAFRDELERSNFVRDAELAAQQQGRTLTEAEKADLAALTASHAVLTDAIAQESAAIKERADALERSAERTRAAKEANDEFFTGLRSGLQSLIQGDKGLGLGIDIITGLLGQGTFGKTLGPIGSAIGGSITGSFNPFGFETFHTGGVVGRGGQARKLVSPAAFAGAPRFHNGTGPLGLAADERAAILQTGERVLSRQETRAMNSGGGGSSVVVSYSIDARGSTPDAIAALSRRMDETERNLPRMIRDAQARARA